MHRVLLQPRAELAELQLLATRLATQRVVMVARLITDEVDRFDFLFSLASSHGRVQRLGFRIQKFFLPLSLGEAASYRAVRDHATRSLSF